MKDLDWNMLRALSATVAEGTLSAAARKLGLTQPTLSRQIAGLEAALGVTLFERVGRRLVPTATGLELAEHARAMSAAAETLALSAAGQAQSIGGPVTISATDVIATHVLPDVVADLRAAYPQITVVVLATDSISDLRRREADIAIRHVRPTEPELIGRRVAELSAHFYASEAWVARHGLPDSPADLGGVDMLAFEPVERFVEHLGREGITVTTARCSIISNNAMVLWEFLRRGLGVGLMLRELAERTPGLVRLLPDRPSIPVPVWLVTHRELRTSRRIRVVFDRIAERFATGLPLGPDEQAVWRRGRHSNA